MERSLLCLGSWMLVVACTSSDPAPTGAAAGAPGSAGAVASGGAGVSGSPSANAGAGAGGAAAGAAGVAGTSAGAAGSTGSAGAAGSGAAAFSCPAGPFTFQLPTGKAVKIPGAPPNDAFNMNNFTNVEGPVWIGDSLYFSEMTGSNMIPPARVLKIAPGGAVTVIIADSGSNGLAVDGNGNLLAAVHKDGSISQLSLSGGAAVPLVSMYEGKRFTSPNDLAMLHDGTIYFSDPNYQNNANPQPAQRLYRVTPPPARTVSAVSDAPSTPNGVTLSPDEKTLYVSGSGLKKFAVMSDGSLGAGSDFVPGSGGDGMVVDCAGNLYVAGSMGNAVRVYSASGMSLGTIQTDGSGTTTNVAFGGTDHKTLYITSQGTEGQRGVHSIALNVPGFPY